MKRCHSIKIILLLVGVSYSTPPVSAFTQMKIDVLSHFSHEFHTKKVFEPQSVPCERCHNFRLDTVTKKVIPGADFKKSTFRHDFKTLCHDCHGVADEKNTDAPHACYTCHQSIDSFRAIKPQNHTNIAWKKTHVTNARVDGDSCLQCHVTSQCAQCHLRRNDIEMNNHTRNFKFVHSVEARAQPQTCDSCHSRSFCVDCHWGKR